MCALCYVVGTLVFVGGVNWGLVGVGYFMGQNWNVVNLLLGQWPTVEAIVYIVVGLAAICMLCTGKCSCKVKKPAA